MGSLKFKVSASAHVTTKSIHVAYATATSYTVTGNKIIMPEGKKFLINLIYKASQVAVAVSP